MITTKVSLQLVDQTVPAIIPVVQGDTGRSIIFEPSDFTIPEGATATYYIQKPSGEAVYNSAEITGNTVVCNLTAQSIIETGENNMQIRIILGEDIVTSFDAILMVRPFRGIGAVESKTEINIFDKAVEEAEQEISDKADEIIAEKVPELEAIVEEVIESIPADYTALTNKVAAMLADMATEFSAEATYQPGDIVIYGNDLYRKKNGPNITGEWIAAQWEAITLGSAIEQIVGNLAPQYDQTATYHKDDAVIYLGDLYICTSTLSVTGTWDASKWSKTDVSSLAPAVDATLTQQGKPADAKAVGDLFDAVVPQYSTQSLYARGDVVRFGEEVYTCIANEGEFIGGEFNPAKWDATTLYDALNDEITDVKADLSRLGTRVDNIEEAEGLHRYGVSGIGQSARALTRLWDAVGMTAQVGTDGDNSNVINNFDDVTPFNRRKCVGDWYIEDGRAVFHVNAYKGDEDFAEDGSMGSFVAVECPRAYYYLKDGVLGVSAHQYPGWKPFDIFCHKHNENETIPYYYKNAYALAVDENGHAVSLPGYDNAQGDYKTLLDKARAYKNGELGNLPMLMPAAYNFYEWALFTVEFATQHCQEVMQGCAGLRYSNDDHVTFVDASHVITNNYYAARVVGECVAVIAANIDQNNAAYQATHRIVAITRCDENGNASATGTHQLVELEDLGKEYYEYDVTGATEYRFAARPYRTGDCNSVSTPSGSPVSNTDSYHPCKYRWHENPYSNQYKTTMDLFNQRVGTDDDDYYLKWYLLDDPTQFASKNIDAADLETDAFAELDITTEHSDYRNGYIKSKKYSERYPDIWIPHETTGSATTYICDYASLVYSSVVRSVRFGGSWSFSASDGFSSAYAFHAPSRGHAYYGGDLCVAQ